MTIVIDSTVTLAWLFEDEATAATEATLDQLVDGDAIVPALWQLEVTNALIDAESHGRLSEAQAARMLHLLDQVPITLDPSADDPVAVHGAARRHNLSAYQASYLVLAQRLALPLATTDDAQSSRRREPLRGRPGSQHLRYHSLEQLHRPITRHPGRAGASLQLADRSRPRR